MAGQLDQQVDENGEDRRRRVPAQHPDRAEGMDREHAGDHPGDEHVAPPGQRRRHDVCGGRDRDQLEDAPPEQLQHVDRRGQVGQPGAEQAAQQHHGGRPGPGPRDAGHGDPEGAEQRADDDRAQAGRQRQLRRARASRLQHEQCAGEAEQAHPQVAPQAELVDEAEGTGHRFGEREGRLGSPVSRDGGEFTGSVGGCDRSGHGSLPTPALPGQVRTVGGAQAIRPATLSARSARAPVWLFGLIVPAMPLEPRFTASAAVRQTRRYA